MRVRQFAWIAVAVLLFARWGPPAVCAGELVSPIVRTSQISGNIVSSNAGPNPFAGVVINLEVGAGAFYFYVGADPVKLDVVEEELRKQIADLASKGLRSEELARAKVSWRSSWLRQQQGNGAMADALGWAELNGRGYGYHARLPAIMEAVTAEQVREVAGRHLNPAQAFTVRVRP